MKINRILNVMMITIATLWLTIGVVYLYLR